LSEIRLERLPALDSLRGIAAFIVVLAHCSLIWPEGAHAQLPLWISFTPVRLLLSSYASVILFFVLSGYVLTFPFLKYEIVSYPAYVVRRLCRIYLPFVAAIIFSAVLYACSHPARAGMGSAWFQHQWLPCSDLGNWMGRHLAMTGLDPDMSLDPVIWSLVYELRISLIFPLIVLLSRKPFLAIVTAVILHAAATMAAIHTGNGYALNSARDFMGTFLLTARFASFFIMGSTCARHDPAIRAWIQRLPYGVWPCMFVIALIGFTIPTDIHNQRLHALMPGLDEGGVMRFMVEFCLGIASSIIIISARDTKWLAKFLTLEPVHWLGKISYSLYLVHLPIIFFLFRMLLGKMDFYQIALLAIATSLAAAAIFYALVERAAIVLGRHLSARMTRQVFMAR
jgi:peptidoglycan/LPS O-acetylase OafA/YrhL